MMYLPNDRVRLPWPAAVGELTDVRPLLSRVSLMNTIFQLGSQQMYKLGNFIRTNLYPTFFDGPIESNEMRAWVGDDNRTVSSAISFMAGYFPERQPPQNAPLAVHIERTLDYVRCAKLSPQYSTQRWRRSPALLSTSVIVLHGRHICRRPTAISASYSYTA